MGQPAPTEAPKEGSECAELQSLQLPSHSWQTRNIDFSAIIPAALPQECQPRLGQELQKLDRSMAERTQEVQEELRQLQEVAEALLRQVTPLLNEPGVAETLKWLPEPLSDENIAEDARAGCSAPEKIHQPGRRQRLGKRARDPSRKLLPEHLEAIDALVKDVLESCCSKDQEFINVPREVSESAHKSNVLDGHVMRRSKLARERSRSRDRCQPSKQCASESSDAPVERSKSSGPTWKKFRRLRKVE